MKPEVIEFIKALTVRPDGDFSHKYVRLVCSHNDMDGLACTIFSKLHLGAWESIPGARPNDVTEYHTARNPQELAAHVKEFLDLVKGGLYQDASTTHTTVMVLITDLTMDPRIFAKYREEGMDLVWCVLDHHPDFRGYDAAMVELQASNLAPGSVHSVDSEHCASYQLAAELDEVNFALGARNRNKELGNLTWTIGRCMEWSDWVDRYDTGHWGEWNGPLENLPVEVAEQLYLTDLTAKDYDTGAQEYIKHRIAAFKAGHLWNQEFHDAVDRQYKVLMGARRRFLDRMACFEGCYRLADHGLTDPAEQARITAEMETGNHPFFYVLDGKPIFAEKPEEMSRGYVVRGIYVRTPEDRIPFFSLISRDILEANPVIDVLMVVDLVRGEVQLRSAKDDVNVGQLARVNGGGGHPRASGFSISTGKEKWAMWETKLDLNAPCIIADDRERPLATAQAFMPVLKDNTVLIIDDEEYTVVTMHYHITTGPEGRAQQFIYVRPRR